MRKPLTCFVSVSAVLILLASTPSAQRSQAHAAPYPRPGVLKLGENDRAVAWEVLRPKGVDHLHYTQTIAVFLSGGKLLTRDLGKPSNPPFERHQGELLGFPAPRTSGEATGAPPAPARAVPHEEEWAGGTPRAIWVELK